MGPEQTLRRETWTDRREFSVCVSFIFKKIQNLTFFEPGHVTTKKTPLRGTHHNRPRGREESYPWGIRGAEPLINCRVRRGLPSEIQPIFHTYLININDA